MSDTPALSVAAEREIGPRVSLVVIAYNELDHAPECIEAILAQDTEISFEVIFVDDGSTDGTADAAVSAAAGDGRFRLIRLAENSGRGAARAAGLAAAHGSLVGFVDADVVLPLDWLRICLDEIPGHAAVGGIAVPDGHTAVLARLSGATPRNVGGSMPITGSNALFDGAALRRMGFDPSDRLGEDFRLAARLLHDGYRLRRVPGLIVRHKESKTYARELRWRFDNGRDAATHPRDVGIRTADLVWIGWCGAWITGVVAAVVESPRWLLLGPSASVAAALAHATARFHPLPLRRFVVACVADVPLLTAYLIGRTIGLPRLISGRRLM